MSAIEQLVNASQQQHQRYFELYGTDPAGGEGLRAQSTSIRGLAHTLADTRQEVIASNFSTEVIPRFAEATQADLARLNHTATVIDAAARTADESSRLNIEGARTVAGHAQSELARASSVPDPDSPAGQATILAIVTHYQTRSVETVETSARAQQAVGQQAVAAATPTVISTA
jgi:hypothetical protein